MNCQQALETDCDEALNIDCYEMFPPPPYTEDVGECAVTEINITTNII